MKKKVWFEACDCGQEGLGNHGYFHDSKRGKCPVPTMSMEAGKKMLAILAERYRLSPAEVIEVEAQLLAAKLEEKTNATEMTYLGLYVQAGKMGIPFELLLASAV
jgi:hypothetical protein